MQGTCRTMSQNNRLQCSHGQKLFIGVMRTAWVMLLLPRFVLVPAGGTRAARELPESCRRGRARQQDTGLVGVPRLDLLRVFPLHFTKV